ncbi:c-type cytochrome biogenesis protein CcmI [Sulfurisoma sediminicola]|uniref:Cytochrome c-type biogenesis protein CcmH n=1 Tax=Sulfurisoma sediminicola TaxID=1381557 RepID=A0A497XKE1_9PROT|nr:c-type cytochrome biogenesis protein CcmI [Sulfurisoma sediminicola]RLJ68442.1 cytochrome c-type biogenesis protein CcmH [Sulfurisoma sediminicola]
MTIAFLAAAATLLLLTLALLLRPYLLRRKRDATASQRRINIAIYRDQLDELERDRAGDALAEADYAVAREEIQRRLLEDGAADDVAPVASGGRTTLIAIALAVPLLAGGLYGVLGNPAGLNPPQPQHKISAAEVDAMVTKLAARLEKEDNPQGWVMLARSYKMLGRFDEAGKAYARAGAFIDNEPALLADYADILVAGAGTFAGKPRELIAKALKLDPDNAHALWLSGTAAFEAGQYKQAVADWERLLKQLEPGSEDAQSVAGSLAEARAKGGVAKPAAKAEDKKVGAGGTVSGRVELAPALKDKAAPGDTVMVIARPADGSRMPLAVLRVKASELPLQFTLDDKLAMNPDNAISSHKEVSIEARISKTGMANPQPGDLLSAPQTVKVGARGIKLLVEQIRP